MVNRQVRWFVYLQVLGLNTNIQFLMDLARHPEFEAGNVHTDFIPQYNDQLFPVRSLSDKTICQAAVALMLIEQEKVHHHACSTLGTSSFNFSWLSLYHRNTVLGICKHGKNKAEVRVRERGQKKKSDTGCFIFPSLGFVRRGVDQKPSTLENVIVWEFYSNLTM